MDNLFLKEIPAGFAPYKIPKSFINDDVKDARKHHPRYVDDFGQALLVNLNLKKRSDINENIIISPFATNQVLNLALAGANETTFSEFVKSMHIPNILTSESVLKQNGLLTNSDDKKDAFTSAVSMWINKEFKVYESYVDSVRNSLNGSVVLSNFSSPSVVDDMNSWVSNRTKKISNVIANKIDKDDEVILLNTLYFKGKWEFRFDSKKSTKGVFTRVDETKKEAIYMHSVEKYDYYSDDIVEAIVLPTEKGPKLIIILPKRPGIVPLDVATKKYLVHDKISHILFNIVYRKVELAIPRFNVSCATSLKDSLSQLGIERAFTDDAQFPYISPSPLTISDVLSAVTLRVTESGIEVGSSTTPVSQETTLPPKSVVDRLLFVADRPFVVALVDDKMALYTGVVRDLDPSKGVILDKVNVNTNKDENVKVTNPTTGGDL